MPFEPVTKLDRVRSWPGDIPIESTYTAGIAAERFLLALKEDGKLLATRCESCGITYCPPTMYCAQSLHDLGDSWVEAGPEGTVQSITALHLGLDGSRLDTPEVYAAIQLDGADTVLIHRLEPLTAASIKIGARVVPVLKPQPDRAGSILDILHFAPV